LTTTKYYRYDSGQSQVAIPVKIAELLGWNHQDEISIDVEFIKGKKGLFLYLKEQDKKG
jgi:bifunctional DNA-binding transcriptional regulator/antitoxin component of YhaV-PrlF toxin-antitoxin module